MFSDPGYIFPQEIIRYLNPNPSQALAPKAQGSTNQNTNTMMYMLKA